MVYYAHQWNSVASCPSVAILPTHRFTAVHGGKNQVEGSITLPQSLNNPFSVKQYGNTKANDLFRRFVLDNPHMMFEITLLSGNIIHCPCVHKQCHCTVLVDVATSIYCDKLFDEEPYVKEVKSSGRKHIYAFGSHKAVSRMLQHLYASTNPNLIVEEEAESFNCWYYIHVVVYNMFNHIYDIDYF